MQEFASQTGRSCPRDLQCEVKGDRCEFRLITVAQVKGCYWEEAGRTRLAEVEEHEHEQRCLVGQQAAPALSRGAKALRHLNSTSTDFYTSIKKLKSQHAKRMQGSVRQSVSQSVDYTSSESPRADQICLTFMPLYLALLTGSGSDK